MPKAKNKEVEEVEMTPEARKAACEAEIAPILAKYGQRFDVRIVPQLLMIDTVLEEQMKAGQMPQLQAAPKDEKKDDGEETKTE